MNLVKSVYIYVSTPACGHYHPSRSWLLLREILTGICDHNYLHEPRLMAQKSILSIWDISNANLEKELCIS